MFRRMLLVLLFLSLIGPYAAAQRAVSETAVAFQDDVKAARLMDIPGVEAIAFNVDGASKYLVVYTSRKAARSFERMGLRSVFFNLMGKYRISEYDEQEIVEFRAMQAQMGTSTGNEGGCGAGTLGIALKDASRTGYLTSAHVAAADGRRLCVNGTDKGQVAPSRRDHPAHDCRMTERIGALAAATRIPVDGITAVSSDAAFVEEIAGKVVAINACRLCPSDFGIIDPQAAKDATMELRTCGRGNTTPTKANVDKPTVLAWVRYPCGIRAMLQDQLLVKGIVPNAKFAPAGYSGAVVYGTDGGGNTKGVLGLVAASDLTVDLTLVNRMQAVLNDLKAANNNVPVSIDTSRACQ